MRATAPCPASAWLSKVNARFRTPVNALLSGAVITVLFVLLVYYSPGENKHIWFITYPANVNALLSLVSFGVSGIYLSFLLTVIAAIVARSRGWVPEGSFKLGRWAWPVLIIAVGYLGLMLLNVVYPSGLASPRGYFNIDWITLLVMFVIAVVGLIVFAIVARPHRPSRAPPRRARADAAESPDGGASGRRGRAHRAESRLLPARGNEYAGRMRNSRVFAMVLAGGEGSGWRR